MLHLLLLLLCAQVIADYHTPAGKSLTRDLMGTINASVDFLVRCRSAGITQHAATAPYAVQQLPCCTYIHLLLVFITHRNTCCVKQSCLCELR